MAAASRRTATPRPRHPYGIARSPRLPHACRTATWKSLYHPCRRPLESLPQHAGRTTATTRLADRSTRSCSCTQSAVAVGAGLPGYWLTGEFVPLRLPPHGIRRRSVRVPTGLHPTRRHREKHRPVVHAGSTLPTLEMSTCAGRLSSTSRSFTFVRHATARPRAFSRATGSGPLSGVAGRSRAITAHSRSSACSKRSKKSSSGIVRPQGSSPCSSAGAWRTVDACSPHSHRHLPFPPRLTFTLDVPPALQPVLAPTLLCACRRQLIPLTAHGLHVRRTRNLRVVGPLAARRSCAPCRSCRLHAGALLVQHTCPAWACP
jgi:hypothetical protein